MGDGRLPLGIMKQAIMKLDSANVDIKEALEDEDLTREDKETLNQISDVIPSIEAALYSIISKEMDEDEFTSETVEMDEIEEFPEKEIDLMEEEI